MEISGSKPTLILSEKEQGNIRDFQELINAINSTLWMPLGMPVFGLPIGVAISAITGKMAFIGIGLPLGMAIGSFDGVYLDKKAEKENRILKYRQKEQV
ncbi:hypothetical protein V6B16_12215 [Salinimicrobium catena]|uniref:hypothetical protein n=1 Tax=Salinimicrobium catena TaxID=390640 RepID=UPI002FE4BEBE